MSSILTDLSECNLISAIEINFFELFQQITQAWQRAEVYDGGDLFWSSTDIPLPFFNPVLRPMLADDAVDITIKALIERGQARNVPIMWCTGPSTRPVDLGKSLEAHGFTHAFTIPGMAADLHEMNDLSDLPDGVVIKEVEDAETLYVWSKTLTACFGIEAYSREFAESYWSGGLGDGTPLHHFTAWLNDEPVAASTVFLGAGVAGIYNVGTSPQARGMGIGSAVTLAALRKARSLGYRVATLHSSDIGERVYRKMGFREYCKLHRYLWKPSE